MAPTHVPHASAPCASLLLCVRCSSGVQEAITKLVDLVTRAYAIKPEICFEVFIHKVDGDLFLSDEHKVSTPHMPHTAS